VCLRALSFCLGLILRFLSCVYLLCPPFEPPYYCCISTLHSSSLWAHLHSLDPYFCLFFNFDHLLLFGASLSLGFSPSTARPWRFSPQYHMLFPMRPFSAYLHRHKDVSLFRFCQPPPAFCFLLSSSRLYFVGYVISFCHPLGLYTRLNGSASLPRS